MAKGEARREQQEERRGRMLINCRIRGLQRWGVPPGGLVHTAWGRRAVAGVGRSAGANSGQFHRPGPWREEAKKNEEASRLPTVMTLGGVLQHAVAMLASGEDRRSGPRRFLAPNPFRRWRLTGGFIPSRGPGWTPGNCYQSADTASRGPGVVTRLAAGPITDPGFCLLAAVSGVGTGETTATGLAMFSHDLGRVCLARLALFQDDRVEDPQP